MSEALRLADAMAAVNTNNADSLLVQQFVRDMSQVAQGVPDGWQPTAENINALPEPVRHYIHDLVSNADPAGTARDLTITQDTIRELEFSNRLLRGACNEVVGCFDAAEAEGLQEALANTTDERLKDLVERRLMYALYACQSLASAPPAPQAEPAHKSDIETDCEPAPQEVVEHQTPAPQAEDDSAASVNDTSPAIAWASDAPRAVD